MGAAAPAAGSSCAAASLSPPSTFFAFASAASAAAAAASASAGGAASFCSGSTSIESSTAAFTASWHAPKMASIALTAPPVRPVDSSCGGSASEKKMASTRSPSDATSASLGTLLTSSHIASQAAALLHHAEERCTSATLCKTARSATSLSAAHEASEPSSAPTTSSSASSAQRPQAVQLPRSPQSSSATTRRSTPSAEKLACPRRQQSSSLARAAAAALPSGPAWHNSACAKERSDTSQTPRKSARASSRRGATFVLTTRPRRSTA